MRKTYERPKRDPKETGAKMDKWTKVVTPWAPDRAKKHLNQIIHDNDQLCNKDHLVHIHLVQTWSRFELDHSVIREINNLNEWDFMIFKYNSCNIKQQIRFIYCVDLQMIG